MDGDDAGLWRVVDAFRVAALGYAVVLHVPDHDAYRHPWLAWAVLGVMAAWTAYLAVTSFSGTPRRGVVAMTIDLALAAGAVLATWPLDTPGRIAAGEPTLPSIWSAAAVLSWAVWRGLLGGAVAGVVISAADLLEVRRISAQTVNNVVLLVLAGVVVGYGVELVRAGRAELAAAAAARAAGAERERLARDIHDSVLQVLGYVRRRAGELGVDGSAGEAAELARLAGEQEDRLRALMAAGPPVAPDGERDLRSALSVFAGGAVTVSGPAEPVTLPAATVAAVMAATAAALDNVARHAGRDARAWVLLEDEGDKVLVTIRDDGAGFADGRPEQARREGRLGMSASIRGRVAEVGGTVTVLSAPGQGTEVELRVSR